MRIKVLGTRGEIESSAPYHSKHSGVLVDNLLFDWGEEEFIKEHPSHIFLTHLHPDHAYFVSSGAGECAGDAPVFSPELHEKCLRLQTLKKPKKIARYKITPIPTHHSKLVKSQAYLLEKAGKRLLYTGDMIWINKEYHHLLKGLDLCVTEASYLRKGGLVRKDKETGALFGHNGVPDLISLFSRFTDKILFIHFGSWFYSRGARQARRDIKKLAQQAGIEAIVGYDSMKLKI